MLFTSSSIKLCNSSICGAVPSDSSVYTLDISDDEEEEGEGESSGIGIESSGASTRGDRVGHRSSSNIFKMGSVFSV